MRTYYFFSFLFFLSVTMFAQFGSQQVITLEAVGARAVVTGDVDGDGAIDVLSASQGDDKIAWYKNLDGEGSFGGQQVIGLLDQTINLSVADIDGDGDIDVLAVLTFEDTVGWFENEDGLGTFSSFKTIGIGLTVAYTVFAADLDGDGDQDVIAGADGAGLNWFENLNGQGNFGLTRPINSSLNNPRSAAAVDVDHDGDLDVIAGSSQDITVSWYENLDGLGNFGSPNIIAPAGSAVQDMFASDIDGDGFVDVVAATNGLDKVAWFKNLNGTGAFGAEQVITVNASGVSSVFCADLDADGDIDVLSSSVIDGKLAWYENEDGLGTFGDQQIISTDFSSLATVHAADIDDDGNMDVLSSSAGDYKIAWYENLVLGLAEQDKIFITLYPNPATNVIRVENGENLLIMAIKIYDVLGRLVLKKETDFNAMDISRLAAGLFFVQVLSEGGILVKKLVKE